MANVFKDISQFTLKSAATGTEEFQVSATEKVTAQQIAALAPSQAITNWSKMIESAYSEISNSDTLLTVLQKIALLSGNGEGYVFNVTNDSHFYIGLAVPYEGSVSGTRVMAYDVKTNLIVTCRQSDLAFQDFIKKSDADKITWLSNGSSVGNSAPLTPAQLQRPGFSELPTSSNLKFSDNKSRILDALRMLTASVCQGRLRTVVGNPSTGASGKPEIAFIVNNVQSASAETQGTNGLQIFHLTSDFIRVIPSTDIAMAWPTLQTLSDEAIIKKLSSTASGDWGSLGTKLAWTGGGGGIETVEITDFAIPGLNITKDGESFLFYANDASNIPNSNHGAISFVGVAIASPIFITGDQRLLYYMMIDTAKAMFYTGYANLEDDVVTWSNTPVTRLGQAVQVTAFTEAAFGALLYSYKPGDFIPFYTSSVTASEANQFPESGVFNGFISMGSNEGDYFQIFAFKTGSLKAYIGACIGSTTQWTALGNSSEGSGPEDIASTLHEDSKYVQASPGAGMGTSTIITLDRALKSTDMILITWLKSSASVPDAEIAGSTIINPGAYSYDVALEYIENANSDYHGLFIDQSYTEVSSTQLSFYAVSNGAAYGPSYLLTGVYNISGK